MSKWSIIAKHEYFTNIKRKEFLITTLGAPLFFIVIVGISILLTGIGSNSEVTKIGFIDKTGLFESSNFTKYDNEELAKKDLAISRLTYFFVIPENYTSSGNVLIYSSNKNFGSNMRTRDEIGDFLIDNLLRDRPQYIIDRVKKPINPEFFIIDENGTIKDDSGFTIVLVPLFFAMLFTVSIFASSGFLLQSIVEEKENRIIEVILSSVSHKELLTGKIIGLGALGLTQILIYLITGTALILINPFTLYFIVSSIHISTAILAAAIVYFLLGFIMFASIMAGIGSVATTSKESQQIAGIFSLAGVFPFMFSQFLIMNPNSILAKALSIFPLTSPISMIMRLSVIDVPVYELMISILVLMITAYLTLEICVKVFRASLLMYGKKPTIKELIRYVQQS